jgi:hypothetical protein
MQALEVASASALSRSCIVPGAPVRIKLRTPMLLRFRCNFVRLKDDLQLFNVPQTCASHGASYRASSTLPALSSGGLENERTTPRATFRRCQLSLHSNEIFGRTNPIPERSRRRAQLRASICCRTRCFSAVFSAGGLVGVNGTTRFVGLRQAVAAMSFRDEVFGTSEWAGGLQLRGTY